MSTHADASVPLAFIPTGETVTLTELSMHIDPHLRAQLTAYGLMPNRPLKVLQQHPMTVILTDEIELALEHGIARHLWVARNANENG